MSWSAYEPEQVDGHAMHPFWKLPHKHNLMVRGTALILRHYFGHLGLTHPDSTHHLYGEINKSLWDYIEVVGPSPLAPRNLSPSDGQLRQLYNRRSAPAIQFQGPMTVVFWVGESVFTTLNEKTDGDFSNTQQNLRVAMGARICFMPFGNEMSRDMHALDAWWDYLTQGSLVAHFKAAVESDSWLPVWLLREIARIRTHSAPSDDASDAFHLVQSRYGNIWEPQESDNRAWLCAHLIKKAMSLPPYLPNRVVWEANIPAPPPIPLPPGGAPP